MICARSSPKTFLPTQSTRGLGLTCLKLFSLLTKSIYNLLKNTDGLFRMVVLSQWFIPYVYFIGHYSVNLIGHFLKFIGFVVARDGVHLPNKFQENWHNSHLLSFSNKDTKKEAQLNSTEKKKKCRAVRSGSDVALSDPAVQTQKLMPVKKALRTGLRSISFITKTSILYEDTTILSY